jgi:hypothetical protein
MRKLFGAKVDEEVKKAFCVKCDAQGYPIGDALEALMLEFCGRVDSADFVLAVKAVKESKPKRERLSRKAKQLNKKEGEVSEPKAVAATASG